ncbi:MAG TPA: TerC family protein [Pirellulales bacterium]|jgi:tellurite resistance protein TerC|nr:TerC family protein [Pirellulales bacterium]
MYSLLPISAGQLFAEQAPPSGIQAQWWHWAAFGVFVAVMLALDLGVFHRHSREPSLSESAFWTVIWTALALAFNGLVWNWGGSTAAIQFLTGYLVEWSLSMDNVFVFAVIFTFFKVPLQYQYRVLFWGILGAIFMRLAFVLVGATLLTYFEWMLVVFGVLLVYTGARLAFKNEEAHPENNWLMRLARRYLPVAAGSHGKHFFVQENGRRCITPLFLVLLVVESTDVLFAIDSVPAIFGVTRDPFIVFTSNIFAILGLRALYFLLAGVMGLFRYLHYGLAAVLIFVGCKMIAEYFFELHLFKDYPWVSLVIIVALLGIAILASLAAGPPETENDQ